MAAVTNYYRHILDGKKGRLNEAEDIKQIFSRPWCRFHFYKKDKAVTDREFVGHRGLVIGKVENVTQRFLEFVTARDVARYDGLQIDVKGEEKPFGFGIKNMTVKGKNVFMAKRGQKVKFELPEEHVRLEVGAPIYLASSTAVKGKYDYQKPKPKEYRHYRHLMLRVEITQNEIWAISDDKAVCIKGTFEAAKDVHKTNDAVYKAFSKTKDSEVCFDEIEVINPDNRFAPVSGLNELRRKLVEALQIGSDNESMELPKIKPLCKNKDEAVHHIVIRDIDASSAVEDFRDSEFSSTWFKLPQICRNTEKLQKVIEAFYQAGARCFVVENYYGFECLKRYDGVKVAAGSFIYVMNRYAAEVLKEIGAVWGMVALESSPDNMCELVKSTPLNLVQMIYGYPPLFTSAVCVRDNDCAHCNHKNKQWFIKNSGKVYKVVSKNCEIQLFSEKPYEREMVEGMWGVVGKGAGK